MRGPSDTHALVVTPLAHMRRAPAHAAELVSQRLLGEVVRWIERRGHWLRVRSWDGYQGWVRDWSLLPISPAGARAWVRTARHQIATTAQVDSDLLLAGSRVRLAAGRGGRARIDLPDGRRAAVERLALRSYPPAPSAGHIIQVARSVLGAPYLWGGVSPAGFDCSGLVQWAFAAAGAGLPRDAAEQWRRLPAASPPAQAGDLIFFGRRDILHVALVTKPPRFLHAYGRVEETTLVDRPELHALVVGFRRPLGPVSS